MSGDIIVRCCGNCIHGSYFKPRPDEIERYGPEVMGCTRPGWEGYTKRYSECEAFHPRKGGEA